MRYISEEVGEETFLVFANGMVNAANVLAIRFGDDTARIELKGALLRDLTLTRLDAKGASDPGLAQPVAAE